jgi:hypothetical protein
MAMDDLIERLRKEEGRRTVKLGNSLSMRYAHREDVRALLREAAAALEAARKDGWQPIETAPKDGNEVILFDSDYLQLSGFEGRYSEPRGSWLSSYDGPVNPTHWMPLPPPPAALRRKEND